MKISSTHKKLQNFVCTKSKLKCGFVLLSLLTCITIYNGMDKIPHSLYHLLQKFMKTGGWSVVIQTLPHSFENARAGKTDQDGEEISCKIPELLPNGNLTLYLNNLQFLTDGKNTPPDCVDNNSSRFVIDIQSNLIRLGIEDVTFWENITCFYQGFSAIENKPDFSFRYGPIRNITSTVTPLTETDIYISIWCYKNHSPFHGPEKNSSFIIYEDILLHVPAPAKFKSLMYKLTKRQVSSSTTKIPLISRPSIQTTPSFPDLPSILMIGMDSESRMNFLRYMPQSYNYLKSNLSAIEFYSLNSVGGRTWKNMIPFYSGHTIEELSSKCGWALDRNQQTRKIDHCPFIWKDFSKIGYITSIIDDGAGLSPFSKKPVDYDICGVLGTPRLIPTIGHQMKNQTFPCFGSRTLFQIILDLVLKFAHRMVNLPYISLTWSAKLSHDINVWTKYGDEDLYSTLKLLNEGRLIQNTIVLVMGDHGAPFGPLRASSSQGYLEERLPILMIVLPEEFRKKFPLATQNMEGNSRRLVTHFDLHATLRHLSNVNELENEIVRGRSNSYESYRGKRGVSLFLNIPVNRTCESTREIDPSYCACANRTTLDSKDKLVVYGADILIKEINAKIKKFPQCAVAELDKIVTASKVVSYNEMKGDESGQRYLFDVSLMTKPSAVFHGIVLEGRTLSEWKVVEISRTSTYGNQADCMRNKTLRPFCFCKK